MSSTIRIAGALLAPLALGACGLPIGVQIASLFADGVSYMTTDKSLTDHGLSAVTGEDCAIWRGVEGNKICKDPKEDKESETIVAALGEPKRPAAKALPVHMGDAGLPSELSGWSDTPSETSPVIASAEPASRSAALAMAPVKSVQASDNMILGTAPAETTGPVRRIVAEQSAILAPAPAPVPATAPIESVKVAEVLPPPPPPAPKLAVAKLEMASVKVPTRAPKKVMAKNPAKAATKAPAKANKATYYIIASYHRAADALRFSEKHGKFKPQVIEGTASGHQVFRVAVGPLDGKDSRAVKARLKKAGFKDTWRLALVAAPVETEVAQIR